MTGDMKRNNDDAQGGSGKPKGMTDADLSARMKALDTQLDRVRESNARQEKANARTPAGPSPLGRAMKLSAEFIAGVGAGALIGWMFDRWVGSSPWGMIGFLMLGFCTGIYNVLRAAGQLRSGPDKPAGD